MDECMYTTALYSNKEYSNKYTNISPTMKTYNMRSTALIGAIALSKGFFCHKIFPKSVDTQKYIKFLRFLKRRHGDSRLALYMDSLSVHACKASKEEYERLEIMHIYCPVYDPSKNRIEETWSKQKRMVAKLRLQDMLTETKRTYHYYIDKAIAATTVKECDAYIN